MMDELFYRITFEINFIAVAKRYLVAVIMLLFQGMQRFKMLLVFEYNCSQPELVQGPFWLISFAWNENLYAFIKRFVLLGELGEYCWSTTIKCNAAESFQHAYVVLPVDVSTAGHDTLEVRTMAPASTTLHVQSGQTMIPEGCGLRYDVTQQFSALGVGTSFCIQVLAQQDVQRDTVLKCPPYLATIWQRNPSQSQKEDGG